MGEAIAFYVISALILGFALLVVSTRNTVHAVLFLVLNFLAVAALYVLLTAQFLAVIQVLVYAGGIVVLYLFVVMLVNLKRPPEDHAAPQRRPWLAFTLSGLVLAQLAAILVWGGFGPAVEDSDRRVVVQRISAKGVALLAGLDEPIQRVHQRQLRHMTRPQLRQLTELLEKARAGSAG